LDFQDAASLLIEELFHIHDHTLIIVFVICALIFYIISFILTTKLAHANLKSGELQLVEVDNRFVLPTEMTIRILMSSEATLFQNVSNNFNIHMTRLILQTMFRNLCIKPEPESKQLKYQNTQPLEKQNE
ncbi:hypothetical protein HPG69_005412, partial [Diceros bicornis minor]